MTDKTLRPLFIAAFAASLSLAASLRAAIPPAENLLPSDTLFLVTVPDCTALNSVMRDSPQWMFWNDPAMRPFHDKFMAKLNDSIVAPLEQDLGVKLADFAGLPQGQLTFAVTQNGWNGAADQTPGIILLLDAKDKSELLKTNLVALQKKWTDAGKHIRTEEVRGVQFSIVPLSTNDVPASLSGIFPGSQPESVIGQAAPAPSKPVEIVIGQFQSLLIVGNSTKAVEPVAAHLTGSSSPALTDNAVFAADKTAQFRGAPVYYGWFNAKTLFNVLSQMPVAQPDPAAPGMAPAFSWTKISAASGLSGLKSVSFAERESHDGSEADFYLSVPAFARTGIFQMIAAGSKDAAPPAFVPADVVKFWRWRVDGQKDWAELQTMLNDISPAALTAINTGIAMINASAQQKDPDFELRKNLIANLGDDFISYQKPPAGGSLADINNAPSLFLFAATNPDQAVAAVNNVAALMYRQQTAPEPRDFLGKKIYSVSLPVPQMPPGVAAPPAQSLNLTASGGYVAISSDSGLVENYLRSAGNPVKPLSATAGLADAAQHIGGMGGGLFGYQNQREIVRSAFGQFKNSAASNGGIDVMATLPQGFRDWMDFSLLPDYDQVSRYFFFSVFNGSATEDGISFKVFAPRPPGLD